MTIRKLVVLEDSLLAQMANNPVFTREFPFIKGLAHVAPKGGCGGCNKSAPKRTEAFAAAKRVFAGLDCAKKRRLRELLNAQSLRISYLDARNRSITLTF